MEAHILHSIGYGMYIVSSSKEAAFNGQIANTVFQITSEPATLAISINKSNLTHEFIESSGFFSVSVLEEATPIVFIGRFGFKSGRSEDKFKDTKFVKLDSGCPAVTDYCIGYLEAKVINKFDCGTHTLFLGQLTQGVVLKDARPMTYAYYHQVKKGTTPKSAPTFIKENNPQQTKPAGPLKYRCTICNYIYDPAAGDPDSGIKPGTPFEELPSDWVCPVCGVGKDKFVREE